jgi:hypothetical protein
MSESEFPTCVRCGQPVQANADCYQVFERMHWLCFHLEFEHRGDADQPCEDPSCPWWHLEVLRAEVTRLGGDPATAINRAISVRYDG